MAKLALTIGKITVKAVSGNTINLIIICATAVMTVLGTVYMLTRVGAGKAVVGGSKAVAGGKKVVESVVSEENRQKIHSDW